MSKAPHALRFAILATDTVAFRLHSGRLEVLLIPVENPDFTGKEGLPGGLIDPKETAEQSAVRHLANKGGLSGAYLEQLYTFSDVDRDPRGRVVSVAHLALFAPDEASLETGAVRGARWCSVTSVPKLAYDHDRILATALERLRARIEYTTIIRHLLPREFTLTDLQSAYESVLGHELDKRNFRKKILALALVAETGRTRTTGASRPAALYHFAKKGVQMIEIL
ncbi:MAG: NUDIX domain-containing protein [Candidatus Pacebacteria bacterium]|nr:NUDIX domain-containing protein [Candidatus Paceibacterota bacterium]